MTRVLNHLLDIKFVKYLKFGVINTLSSLIIIYVLLYMQFDPYLSNLIGYMYGVVQSFFLNKLYVFSASKVTSTHLVNFIFGFVLAYALNLIVLWLFINVFLINIYFAQFLCMGLYAVVFFLYLKFQVFND